MFLETGMAAVSKRGERDSGDRHLVHPGPNRVLVAVVDGLGHGEEAAIAAETAVRVLRENADDSIDFLMSRCDERLRRTRGAAMSLAVIDARVGTLTWVGVGNVEGVLIRADAASVPAREYLISRPGVVGAGFPATLHLRVLAIAAGDLLIFATDGVAEPFAQHEGASAEPQRLAEELLARYGRADDDALVLVAKYLGAPR